MVNLINKVRAFEPKEQLIFVTPSKPLIHKIGERQRSESYALPFDFYAEICSKEQFSQHCL